MTSSPEWERNMTLIISKNGKNAQKVPRSVIEKEDYLQQYIYDNPESVPLSEIDDSIRLLVVAREVPTDSGPIDALGLDADGTIYLIETKLYKNPDKRLVVAQVLDYGAALQEGSTDYAGLLKVLDDKASKQFGCRLNEKLAEFFDLNEEGVDTLLENMKTCLDTGSFRFVVLMDTIHARLKDLITFINENSRFTIYGVQLQYYKYKEYEIMIPSLFGAEVRKRVGSSSRSSRQWDEPTFFHEVNTNLPKEHAAAVQRLYDFSREHADSIAWGSGLQSGSFKAKFDKVSTRPIFFVLTSGHIEVRLDALSESALAEEYRDALMDRLGLIKELRIPTDRNRKFFQLPPDKWVPVVGRFLEVLEEVLVVR